MSFSSFRRHRPRLASQCVDDGRSALRHEGTSQDFLRRHARDCLRYDRASLTERFRFARDFMERIADTNNLMCAAIHLVQNGDKAPGPNRQRLHRLMREDVNRVWQELRVISAAVLDGSYEPGPTRRVDVPKSNGRGTRPIVIANWQDQVVQRAIVQILDPFLDYQFDELSLGYRTGHDRFEAIARAGALVELGGRQTLLCTDLTNAFTRIPHAPLLQEIERRMGNTSLARLICRIISAGDRRKGISQGGALSPQLLNLFLDGCLDQPWRRDHPDVPLIRVADDLLLLCGSAREAECCLDALGQLLRPTGMSLNLSEEKTQIRNLYQGETANWLGFALSWDGSQLCANLHEDFYRDTRDTLAESLAKADGVLHTREALRGLIDQLGPCYVSEEASDSVFCHLTSLAADVGFLEFPEREDLLETWINSMTRYEAHRRLSRLVYLGQRDVGASVGSGSASSQSPPALEPANSTGPTGAPSEQPAALPLATLTVTSAQPAEIAVGWAFHVAFSDYQRIATKCRAILAGKLNRSILTAALAGIRSIPLRYAVRIVTDCEYLVSGWRSVMYNVQRCGSVRGRGGAPPNWDLMVALDGELAARRTRFELCQSGPPDPPPQARPTEPVTA